MPMSVNPEPDTIRKIIHVDMDAFYASVEQLDDPNLQGKPVAVGGNRERGVVAAASYEARAYGVRSAMSSKLAAQKCPHLIFVPPRFERYRELSHQIREIFFSHTDLVEPLSLDEAFLDVTANKKQIPSAILIARKIREAIKAETGLNASAGISYNKFLAKIASDLNKPNGQAVILPKDAENFLEKLPIEKFFGIGKVTAEKMKSYGIHNGRDLKQFSLPFLTQKFGKSGLHYHQIVRGIHQSPVQPDRERKSISAENTFSQDLFEPEAIQEELKEIHAELLRRIQKHEVQGRTITLKIKYRDFSIQTRSKSLEQFVPYEAIWGMALELMEKEALRMPIRLLGLGLSNLQAKEENSNSYGEQLWIDEDWI
jgi:DNA polymerase IV